MQDFSYEVASEGGAEGEAYTEAENLTNEEDIQKYFSNYDNDGRMTSYYGSSNSAVARGNNSTQLNTQFHSSKHARDWNEEFQTLYQQYQACVFNMYESGKDQRSILSRLSVSKRIGDLFADFTAEATQVVKTIVLEKSLPIVDKSIKPNSLVGGIAGGQCLHYPI